MRSWGRDKAFLTDWTSLRHSVKPAPSRGIQIRGPSPMLLKNIGATFSLKWFSLVFPKDREHAAGNIHIHLLSCYRELRRSRKVTARQKSLDKLSCAARQDSSLGRDSACHDETPLLFLDFSLHEAESASRCFTARLKKASCRCRVSVLTVCVLDPLETVPRLPFPSVSSCSPFPSLEPSVCAAEL